MPIVGGLDIHRKQITFDYLDTATGEVKRGQIAPADRAHLRSWLVRFAGRNDVAFALEGCTGWRYIAEELAAAGITAHVAEPADTAFARGRKRHAKTDKTDSRHLRELLAEAGCQSAGSRRPASWNAGRCSRRITLFGLSTPPQRSCAVFFHQGAPALGEAALRTDRALQALRAAAAAHLSPAGQLQVATALGVLAALEARLEVLRHELLLAARSLTGARVLAAAAVRGRPGHRAGDDLLAGRRRPVLLLPQGGPVRRAGRHRLVLRPQGPARAAVPAGPGGAALGGV